MNGYAESFHSRPRDELLNAEVFADVREAKAWARRLMPGSADPRTNLALVFEQAGRVDDALAAYVSALEVQPEHLPALQGLTKLQVKHHREDDRTMERLRVIALQGDERWRAWAQAQTLGESPAR